MKHISQNTNALTDSYGRRITYLRLSVTDRCDLRCRYCMAENMAFLPKKDVLSLEEMLSLSEAFMRHGVRRIRLTGGEPLVRRDIMVLINALGGHVRAGNLDEITLTTNGTQLERYASELYEAGMRRINVSLDSLNAQTFASISRRNKLQDVLNGIEAAKAVGLQIKINMVAMKGTNDQEALEMLDWCIEGGYDLTMIETMPMGDVSDDRADVYIPLDSIVKTLKTRFNLIPSLHKTGGPARYFEVAGRDIKLGLITPLSNNFCDGCNRVRVTCTGRIYMCLGQDDHLDLRPALQSENASYELDALLQKSMRLKPLGHDFAAFDHEIAGKVNRHMSVTGG